MPHRVQVTISLNVNLCPCIKLNFCKTALIVVLFILFRMFRSIQLHFLVTLSCCSKVAVHNRDRAASRHFGFRPRGFSQLDRDN